MSDDAEKRRRRKRRKEKHVRRELDRDRGGPMPDVTWPPPPEHVPIEQYTDAELLGAAICPLVTGIGRHPRTVTDEDWVLASEIHMKRLGARNYLRCLLTVLRMCMPVATGTIPRPGNYPERRSEGRVPLPTAEHRYNDDTRPWTEGMVIGMVCNPIYAGILPYPAIIPETMWLNVAVKMMQREMSPKQFLVNLLHQLKDSYVNIAEDYPEGIPPECIPPEAYGIE